MAPHARPPEPGRQERGPARFVADLRRRRVGRVAITYLAIAWLLVQVADTLQPMLGLPDATGRILLGLLAIGFPVALVLGWVFDLSPEGITVTGDADRADSAPAPGSRTWALVAAGAVLGGILVWGLPQILSRAESAGGAETIRRIAILPLASLVADEGREYFVDGMHDAMINELAKVTELMVLSRNSVLPYRDSELPLGRIAEDLGVDGLILGSVFRGGDSVRINVQLLQPDPEETLWVGSYEGALDEALGLHRRVARAVAGEVRISLGADESRRLETMGRVDPRAQELYLRGVAALRTRTTSGIDESVELLREAVRLAPDFADGWGVLAEAEAFRLVYNLAPEGPAEDSATERMGRAVERALRLDPAQPAALTLSRLAADDVEGRIERLRYAIELNPNYAQAWNALGDELRGHGQLDEALEAHRRAQLLDPLHPVFTRDVGFSLFALDRVADAERELRRALEIQPQVRLGRLGLVNVLMRQGRFDEAVDEQITVLEELGASDAVLAAFRAEYEAGGGERALRWMLDITQDLALDDRIGRVEDLPDHFDGPGFLPWMLKEREAIDLLERAVAGGS